MISGHAIATLVVYLISVFFVIYPVYICTPRPLSRIPINLTTAPVLAIALLWATKCLDAVVIYDGIVGVAGVKPYNILILFLSRAYMVVTIELTGVLKAAATWVVNKGGRSGWKLYLYCYLMLTILSILLGNDSVIISGTAFLVYFTEVSQLDPFPWVMAGFAAANTASMVLFTGNATNVVICEGFSINNAAFTAYTIFPFLACHVFGFVSLAFQYRKRVPRVLGRAAMLDARSHLTDPFGALTGGCMFAAMVILSFVASFFGIDVWMISLPFAATKLIFDLAWDHYRYSRGLLHRGLPMTDEKELEGVPTQDITPSRSSSLDGKRPVSSPHEAVVTTIRPRRPRSLPSLDTATRWLLEHFPTSSAALPRLPFALVPFAFSQFILVEALDHQGWVEIFARWLVRASHGHLHATLWLVGVVGILLCNCSGTNICATILLTRIVRAAALTHGAGLGAAIALGVVSNIGVISFTFSASLAGLLWRGILLEKRLYVRQRDFAFWNLLPLLVMTIAGLGVVSLEMVILRRS